MIRAMKRLKLILLILPLAASVASAVSSSACGQSFPAYTGHLDPALCRDEGREVIPLSEKSVDQEIQTEEANGSNTPQSIDDVIVAYKQQNSEYRNTLDGKTPFLGFYFTADYGQYISQDYAYRESTDYEYRFRLRWELFDNGYYESRKQLDRAKNAETVHYLQFLSVMFDREYDEQKAKMQEIVMTIDAHYYRDLLDDYNDLLDRQQREMGIGLLTIDDLEKTESEIQRAAIKKALYENEPDRGIEAGLFRFLNQIDTVMLKPKEELKEHALQESTQVKLQEAYMQRSDYLPEYTDKLKVSVYANHRKVDEVGWYNTVGVFADIPISIDFERSKLERLESNGHKLQQTAIRIGMQQQIDALYRRFYYQQSELAIAQNDLHFVKRRIARAEKNADSVVPATKTSLTELKIERIRADNRVVMARLELLRILLELYHVSHATHLEMLIETGEVS